MDFLQIVINGILLGGFYALLGLGMTLILGIVGITNLLHGEAVVLGAYASALISAQLRLDPILSLFLTMPVMFCFGFVLHKLLIGRAMRSGSEAALLVTFGFSIILQDGMLLLFSADAQHIQTSYGTDVFHIGNVDLPLINVILFGISLVVTVALLLFLEKTKTGRAIRAASDDRGAAILSGVDAENIDAVAMGIAMATAAAAGGCVGIKWTFYPSSGSQYLLIAFIVVVIGGMGIVPGTLLAGLLFGVIQVAGGAKYGLMISYVVLLGILAFRPKGLMGKQQP